MKKIRVGIIGLQPERSWAAVAHLPGLRSFPEKFEAVGVANRKFESTLAAAKACNIPQPFKSVDELVNSPDIDLVTVTVRVPNHKEVLIKALNAKKNVYCEWPLAVNLEEAKELTELADKKGVKTFIGTQAIANPQIETIKSLIHEEKIGKVISHSIVGYGRINGDEITDEATEMYLLDKETGATMLTISVMHTIAALQYVDEKISVFNCLLKTARPKIFSRERNDFVEMSAADEVGVQGFTSSRSVFSLHYTGGMPYDNRGFLWEIIGTKGTLRLSAISGAIQIEDLKMEICLKGENSFREIKAPEKYLHIYPKNFIAGNVGRMYERIWNDLNSGTHTIPDFHDALELHKLLDEIKLRALRDNKI